MPADTDAQLKAIVAHLKDNPSAMAVLSGFHDASGNAQTNEELALNRARAVRAALMASGIAKERVEMSKPQVTTGSGPAREARRVEVSVR